MIVSSGNDVKLTTGRRCAGVVSRPPPPLVPWTQATVSDVTQLQVDIGKTGEKKGYEAFTRTYMYVIAIHLKMIGLYSEV